MAAIEFKNETVMKYADEFMKKLAAGEKLISPEQLSHASKISNGFSINVPKTMFFGYVGEFLENFAKKEPDFLRKNSELLTPENLKKVTEEIVKRGDKDKSGTIDWDESKTLITGLDPKQLLIQVSGKGQVASR